NVFAVYMSDSNGSFVTLTPVGWIMQTGADTIVCTIPANTLPGSNYRVIIISMSPAWASAPNEYPIRIDTAKQPSVTIAASPGLTVGPWVPVTFTATISGGGSAPIYQWKKNGIDIAGANAATYKGVSAIDFTTNDNITCVMTSNSACATVKSASSNSLTLNVTLGIDQPGSGKDISLYTNPNKGDFTLSGVDTYNNLEIADVTGRVIYRADITAAGREMKISLGKQVASGHYFLRLTSAQATEVLKLTIH
ncbi:MAG: hypothetical protein K0R82_2484, partial [Flavipsychrobacter sp.]|nr:hypothetical protein [Flavipsychrobacter sp.]